MGAARPALAIHEVSCPTQVVTGAHDHNVDPCRAERIARAIPDARLVTFPETAHMPDLEEPQSYVECLLEFLS